MGFLDTVIKDSGNEFASIVSNGIAAGDVDNYVDTGSYIFNALVSGSLFGGIPSNKVTALAGESSTGKTFFALSVVRNFLEANPCLLYTSPSPRDRQKSRMPSSA